jgi:hypothetical protein
MMLNEELKECKQIDRGEFVEFWTNDQLLHCQFKDGWQIWFDSNLSSTLHRNNGPAVIKPDGTQYWYQNGKIHRDNGPAIIRADGSLEYWNKGVKIN